MSTRKSVNKQNSTSPVALSTESSSTVIGTKSACKIIQDVGSESEPTTPTSKDSNTTIGSETKRRRRPNSVLNTPTSKKTDNEQTLPTSEKTDVKSAKGVADDSKVDDKDSTTDSPTKRKRKVVDKSAIMTRKTSLSLANCKTRSQRATVRKASIKSESPPAEKSKKKITKKLEPSTPLKRKREDSVKSDEEKRPEKQIKLEKPDTTDDITEDSKVEDELQKKENEEIDSIADEDVSMADTSEVKVEADEDVPSGTEDQDGDSQKLSTKIQTKKRASNKQQLAKNRNQKDEQSAYEKPKRGRPKKISINAKETEIKKEPPSSPKKETEDVELSKSPVPEDKGPIDPPKDGKSPEPPVLEEEIHKESTLEPLESNNLKPDDSLVNGIEEPLTVDTTNSIALEKETASTSSAQDCDKAASLSPELVSEGVSEISVKQFYKKPEFLENNLGIEKDPKLGEIVQKVEAEDVKSDVIKEESQPTNENIESNTQLTESEGNGSDSLKEGELLILDDSTEEESSKQGTPISSQYILEVDNEKDLNSPNPLEIDETSNKDCESPNSKLDEKVEILKIISDHDGTDDVNVEEDTKSDASNDKEETILELSTDINIKVNDNDVEPKVPSHKVFDAIVTDGDEKKSNDDLSNDSVQGEIDSGVSDIAENNSSDPHEDINSLLDEKIESDLKNESDVECDNDDKVNQCSEEVDTETFKSDCDIKENKENIEMDSSIPMVDNCDIPQGNKNIHETPETLKQKENHLKSLGLLTHQAACEAKIEKQRRRQLFQNSATSSKKSNNNGNNSGTTENGKSMGSTQLGGGNGNKNSQEYTGTLKTVIKLNRQTSSTNVKNKSAGSSNANGGGRLPLKMTFQKGRGRGANVDKGTNSSTNSFEDTYYTIQNETEIPQQESTSHGRKPHNRSHNTESGHPPEVQVPAEKKEEKEIIVIPEKASSFSIHPGRLCQDQCFYCGGKFGLYDTPCHIAQLKSAERQKKILESEEKLTVDNCLCDACFRHVDRRANVPSYKKRLSAPPALEGNSSSGNDALDAKETCSPLPHHSNTSSRSSVCFVTNCEERATHSLRRKGFRKTIKKLFGNDVDLSTLGALVPICDKHYEKIIQYLECALCKRRLAKNHMYHITQDIQVLEKLLSVKGISVQLQNNSAICKLCRYYTNLLLKPPEGKSQKAQFVKNYQRRLLNFHNIQSLEVSDGEDQSDSQNTPTVTVSEPVVKRGRKPKKIDTESTRPQSNKTSCDEGNSTPPLSEDGSTGTVSKHTTSGQMMLDNDVMVDYDVPMISDSPSPPAPELPSKLQTILQGGSTNRKDDISKVLRSNPNISMRELFPGEEEMGLHINLPFGSSTSQRTPEGWTRIQTFLQYDEPTRRLWENLQKPYGNQSSFLRHLILLEKYFRNGDLVLSQNASTNAVGYSDTVQNRLKSYDSGISASGTSSSSSRPTVSQLLQQSASMQQFSNLPITITARPKSSKQQQQQQQQNSSTSNNSPSNTNSDRNSILKSNLLGRKNSAIEILPIGGNSNTESSAMTKQEKILAAASRLVNSDESGNQSNTQKQSAKQKLGTFNTNLPPELISINRNLNSLLITRNRPPSQCNARPGTSKSSTQQIIKLPDTLSPHERVHSKSWRPSLIPVSQDALANQSGVLYETADGRKLPGLVQVLSGGRPFLISIHDYNRMCILRREKILREQMLSSGSVHGSNKHSSTGNDSKSDSDTYNRKTTQQQSQGQQNKMQIPHKLLEQNSVLPIGGEHKNYTKKTNQTSMLKPSPYLVPIAPKPPSQLQILPQTIVSPNLQQQQQLQQQSQQPAQTNAGGNNLVSFLPSALSLTSHTSTNSSTSWLWSNLNESNSQVNGAMPKINLTQRITYKKNTHKVKQRTRIEFKKVRLKGNNQQHFTVESKE